MNNILEQEGGEVHIAVRGVGKRFYGVLSTIHTLSGCFKDEGTLGEGQGGIGLHELPVICPNPSISVSVEAVTNIDPASKSSTVEG